MALFHKRPSELNSFPTTLIRLSWYKLVAWSQLTNFTFHAAFLHRDIIKHERFYCLQTVFSTSGKDTLLISVIQAEVIVHISSNLFLLRVEKRMLNFGFPFGNTTEKSSSLKCWLMKEIMLACVLNYMGAIVMVSIKTRIFCMLRNTRSKLLRP
jgi:hypothetical protein